MYPLSRHFLIVEDQTSHLMWRLQHGEVFVKHPPQVSVVLIGTNDLGAAASCNVGEPGATAAANGTAARCAYICMIIASLEQQSGRQQMKRLC